MTIFKGIKNVLGFLTLIPVGMDYDTVEEVARYMWLFPVVGAIIAFVAASIGYFAMYILPASIVSAIVLFILLFLTGFHHLDGLLDFGDAVMFRGDAEKRQAIMHDKNTGVGGFGLGFFVLLVTYLSLNELTDLIAALIVAETSAKFSMVFGAYIGNASHKGMGSAFVRALGKNHRLFFLSLLIYLLLAYAIVLEKSFAIIPLTIIFSAFMVYLANKLFGGVSGDIFGAMNELTRMFVLLALVML
jgi:adenosylcobinamide-GDP ribazoletransferase